MRNGFPPLRKMPTFTSKSRGSLFITFGDPSGIGPEILLKSLQNPRIQKSRVVVIGDKGVLQKTEKFTRLVLPKKVSFVDLQNVDGETFRFGTVSQAFGRASFEYVQKAVEFLKGEKRGVLVTAPLHKESLQKGGLSWPGHTEILKDLTGSQKVNMLFVGRRLRVSLVTWHISIKELPSLLTEEKIVDAISLLHGALRTYFLKKNPRIGVCALNPHAGEGGLFGKEEKEIITPALQKVRRKGILVTDPLPADTLFYQAYRGAYDGVVAMYHDQGLIPFKMIEREFGVNVTLGLPFLRTSPDHGTAFDIAGKNRADPRSMTAAILLGQTWIL